jgi:hypothetical protein
VTDLDVIVGDWRMTASLAAEAGTPPLAHTSFEWLEGRRFLRDRSNDGSSWEHDFDLTYTRATR